MFDAPLMFSPPPAPPAAAQPLPLPPLPPPCFRHARRMLLNADTPKDACRRCRAPFSWRAFTPFQTRA